MSRLKIYNPAHDEPGEPAPDAVWPSGFYPRSALHGHGTVIELDGRPLRDTRTLRLHIAHDSNITAHIEILATPALDVELNADVKVAVGIVAPGLLIIQRAEDGQTQNVRFITEDLYRRTHEDLRQRVRDALTHDVVNNAIIEAKHDRSRPAYETIREELLNVVLPVVDSHHPVSPPVVRTPPKPPDTVSEVDTTVDTTSEAP